MSKVLITISKHSVFTLCAFLFTAVQVLAQSAKIKGVVMDSTLNEPAIVTLELKGAKVMSAASDVDGNFLFEKLPAGKYELNTTGMGFAPKKIIDITLKDKETLVLDFWMHAESSELEAAVITATAITNSSRAVINEVKLATQVANGISQEQIKISQDRNAAQVMSRIPGVTVVDGRFIMVRGIPERYNQVLLNNAIAPSTEVDKRTFSFDLIPSNVLDRMMIYKSGSPENPGDFAGGLIKVFTSNAAEENYTDISLSTGYRLGTTFGDYVQSQGSATDAFGFDNGYRQLPSTFPTTNLRGLPNRSQTRADAAKMLPNNFAPETSTAMPDLGIGLSLARTWRLGSKKLNTISGINYSQSYITYDRAFNRYLEFNPENNTADKRFDYIDNNNERDNRIGVISNWALEIDENNRIEFKNLFNQIGENTTVVRTGTDFIQQTGLDRKNYMYQYRSRSVYSGQLEGKHDHKMFKNNAQLNWVLGLNYLGEDQPDLRRFRTIETGPGTDQFRMVLPPSSNLYDAGRFYSELSEMGYSHSLNYSLNLSKKDEGGPVLKAGYMIDYRSRRFDTRYFSYFYPGSNSINVLQQLEVLPLDQIFAPQNIKVTDGFLLEEGTRASDSYTASNLLTAGYASITYPIGNLNLSAGIRAEYNVLKMDAVNDAGAPISVNNPVLSPLFFLNSDYTVTEKSKLRFAYFRSVNRPEFRELAPFLFYDYQFDAERYGNPNLVTATIDNIDLRYEIYPRAGEAISFGAFYKHFTNPIETLILIRSESPAFSFQNAASAYSTGFELEARKSFQGVTGSKFIDKLSMNLNAAYIFSQVDYGAAPPPGQEAKRALQGQSPYIINAILSYADPVANWNISASYNVFGPRIFAVGSTLFPAIYEMPRHAIDLTISKRFKNNWTAKLGIQDLVNSAFRYYQDTDRDTKININGFDDPIFNFKRGTLFNLSLSYKF